MADGETHEKATAGLIRQLRLLAETAAPDADSAPGWRDDLRLFAVTWAAGFLFFLIFLA